MLKVVALGLASCFALSVEAAHLPEMKQLRVMASTSLTSRTAQVRPSCSCTVRTATGGPGNHGARWSRNATAT